MNKIVGIVLLLAGLGALWSARKWRKRYQRAQVDVQNAIINDAKDSLDEAKHFEAEAQGYAERANAASKQAAIIEAALREQAHDSLADVIARRNDGMRVSTDDTATVHRSETRHG